MSLAVVPCTIAEAKAFVRAHHRHHGAPVSGLFAVAAAVGTNVCAVAIVGRPVARMLDDGWTVEVTRLASNGERNACSMLYRAAWRASRALGWRRLITYTHADESGASLRGAGFRITGEVRGESWSRPSRPRVDTNPLQDKFRWEVST